jgi:hypothetical protein
MDVSTIGRNAQSYQIESRETIENVATRAKNAHFVGFSAIFRSRGCDRGCVKPFNAGSKAGALEEYSRIDDTPESKF